MDPRFQTIKDLRGRLEAITKDLEHREAECREIRHKRNALASVIDLLSIDDAKPR